MPDESRALTDKGAEQAAVTARLLKRLEIDLDRLYTSPRVRAMQTAKPVAEALELAPEVREELNYGFNASRLSALLADLPLEGSVMVVGHEPTLSNTIQSLTGARVEMKKCGLARVDIVVRQPLQGELVWLLTPKLVRALSEE